MGEDLWEVPDPNLPKLLQLQGLFISLITAQSRLNAIQYLALINTKPRHERCFLFAGNALSSCPKPMTLDNQMMLALLQELLMTLRANHAVSYKSWLALGIDELER